MCLRPLEMSYFFWAGSDFRQQNLIMTSLDVSFWRLNVRFWRLKTVPILKEKNLYAGLLGQEVIHILTWHFSYYFEGGDERRWADFVNPVYFGDGLAKSLSNVKSLLAKNSQVQRPLWIGEKGKSHLNPSPSKFPEFPRFKFPPTWNCVSLPWPTTLSGWKLLILV